LLSHESRINRNDDSSFENEFKYHLFISRDRGRSRSRGRVEVAEEMIKEIVRILRRRNETISRSSFFNA
jgi:hypothetical protein